MIILDTNVISEPLKAARSPAVTAWLNDQVPSDLYVTTISLAELFFGIACLPLGRRRANYEADLEQLIAHLFDSRILPFDIAAAQAYARLAAHARSIGQVFSFADGCIAAIAHVHRFKVATRDAAPFESAGLSVIDPWAAP